MTDWRYLDGHPPACTCVDCTRKRRYGTLRLTYRRISWNELKEFLHSDRTDMLEYIPGVFVCEDFARTLQRNAKAVGIDCQLVYVDIIGEQGHMCNAFQTTDRGTVYVDCTAPVQVRGERLRSHSKVEVSVGRRYVRELIFPSQGYDRFLEPLGEVVRIDVI